MSQKYKAQKTRRFEESLEKFRQYNVLKESDIQKLHNKAEFLEEYIKTHVYVNPKGVASDFLFKEFNMKLLGSGENSFATEIRKLLINSFRPLITKYVKSGVLKRYNTKTYKRVDKNGK